MDENESPRTDWAKDAQKMYDPVPVKEQAGTLYPPNFERANSEAAPTPLETQEQEKNRLVRKLHAQIQESEMSMRSIRGILTTMEIRQKKAYDLLYTLQESETNTSRVMNLLRKHLES